MAVIAGSMLAAVTIALIVAFAPDGTSSAVTVGSTSPTTVAAPSKPPAEAAAAPIPPSPSSTPASNATVGALFDSSKTTGGHCTASVVDSPQGDLLITAAHCISGSAAGMVFVPDYGPGSQPYGSWPVVAAYGATDWIRGGDTQDDFAFLVVGPKTRHGQKVEIEDLTGGNALASAPAAGRDVTVTAYNDGSTKPVTCTLPVYRDDGFLAFNCGTYVDGTSGGPWLVATSDGDDVVGVIGGLHQGGCYPNTSYSSAFGAAVQQTYAQAVEGAAPDEFPSAGSDGCTTGL
jgi:V8-like Glu-specific endopeptidase